MLYDFSICTVTQNSRNGKYEPIKLFYWPDTNPTNWWSCLQANGFLRGLNKLTSLSHRRRFSAAQNQNPAAGVGVGEGRGQWGEGKGAEGLQARQWMTGPGHWLLSSTLSTIFPSQTVWRKSSARSALIYCKCWSTARRKKLMTCSLSHCRDTCIHDQMMSLESHKSETTEHSNITMEKWKSPILLERNTWRASPFNQIIITTSYDKTKTANSSVKHDWAALVKLDKRLCLKVKINFPWGWKGLPFLFANSSSLCRNQNWKIML